MRGRSRVRAVGNMFLLLRLHYTEQISVSITQCEQISSSKKSTRAAPEQRNSTAPE